MIRPDVDTIALVFLTALLTSVISAWMTAWLVNRNTRQQDRLEGWNEHAAYIAEQVTVRGSDVQTLLDFYTDRTPEPVAYHTGGDKVADLRPAERAWNPDE